MECIRPLKAGFDSDYNLTFSQKKFNKELAPLQFPCRKCLACRLNMAREKAIRCIHEAKMHDQNMFLTLTYDQDNLGDGRLHYIDFQLFMKKLLKHANKNIHCKENRIHIPFMVTGEYGDKTKRPHWHAIIFNYRPTDAKKKYTHHTGETVYESEEISKLWGKGLIEFASVNLETAGYVARYAAKKLGHGNDQDHDYHPIHKTSSKRAIGKSFLEKYYLDIFNAGFVVLPNGQKASIPRYYVDWLKKNHPEKFEEYASTLRLDASKLAEQKEHELHNEYLRQCELASGGIPLNKKQVSMTILKQKFTKLQERLKL